MKSIKQKSITSLLAAQFVSALADNALLILAMALLHEQGYPLFWVPLLKLMFTLSYVLLGPWVGAWADTWPKPRVMMWANSLKAFACMLMILGAAPMLAFGLVGLGAAIYAPAKYGLITELTPAGRLIKANGWIEVSTVCAALFGVMLGGVLVAEHFLELSMFNTLNELLGDGSQFNASLGCLLVLYGLAAWLNKWIPDSGIRYQKHQWNIGAVLQGYFNDHLKLWRDPLGSTSLMVTTLFWGVGATLQLLVLAWAQTKFNLSLEKAAYFQGVTALGIIGGAGMAARFISLSQAPKVLWIGILMGLLVPLMSQIHDVQIALVFTGFIGFVGGFFVVPMNAILQHRGASLLTAGRSISVQNVNENFNILVMMGIYSALIHVGLDVNSLIWLLGAAVVFGMSLVQWRYVRRVKPVDESSLGA